MTAFKAGDRVKWEDDGPCFGEIIEKQVDPYQIGDWLIREDNGGTVLALSDDLALVERASPLAEFEPLIAFYVLQCRLALTMGGGGGNVGLVKEALLTHIEEFFGLVETREIASLIMARAMQGFEYSDERRDAILAAIREEMEGMK